MQPDGEKGFSKNFVALSSLRQAVGAQGEKGFSKDFEMMARRTRIFTRECIMTYMTEVKILEQRSQRSKADEKLAGVEFCDQMRLHLNRVRNFREAWFFSQFH